MSADGPYAACLLARLCLAVALFGALTGCTSTSSMPMLATAAISDSPKLVLTPGDQLKIDFFGAPELNTVQTIRRDGNVTFKLIGDVKADGLTPEALQTMLQDLYKSQLQIQSVSVVVESAMPVFVMGSVLKPGRLEMVRPMTALEAIVQAGGFDPTWANVKRVVVMRREGGERKSYVLNFKDALAGKRVPEFYLWPHDIVYVPQRRF